MNSNRIKLEGFSNPTTERLFLVTSAAFKPLAEEEECDFCGGCAMGFFVNPQNVGWILCLNRKSPYCFETVDALFSCPAYEPSAHQVV